jgi:hypothetical protein
MEMNKTTPSEMIQTSLDHLYHEVATVGVELGEDLQEMVRTSNRYYLTIRLADESTVIRMPFTLAAGLLLIGLSFREARWTLLATILVLFARFHLIVEPKERVEQHAFTLESDDR